MTDPYLSGMISPGTDPFYKKQVVEGRLVVVLSNKFDRRDMTLIPQASRAVLRYEIHELVLTDETAAPNDTINRVFGIGFFEVTAPGLIVTGDSVHVSGRSLGTVAGFNGDHMPNHLNIVVQGSGRKTGAEMGMDLEDPIVIEKK